MNAKYQRVASLLEGRIRDGELMDGERLPGEADLARELQVSRGTIRQAIGELQRRSLVNTQMGVGSFVTFDGVALDTPRGWADAFAVGGISLNVEVLGVTHQPASVLPSLDPSLGAAETILVRRVRRLADGTAVSYESALVPAVGDLRGIPDSGLINGSLTATLAAAGFRAVRGEQLLSVEPLDRELALVLGRAVGVSFLRSTRTSFSRSGDFVEHVVSYLDPEHFSLRIAFGDRP
ncbi:GntR family transcriptional regulator [Arthrobacter sp. NPDC090010]|uniref:GntR family transcriptional regulator n=1 Tax=Arthrobacter sp. NPDC090010 TaxID=3363942 RepID=UPI00381FAD72